jgi:hypothetical protein
MYFLRRLRSSALLLLAALLLPAAQAAPSLSKYPLRVNILSSSTKAYWIQPSLGGPMPDVGSMVASQGDAEGPGVPMGGGLALNYDPVQMFYGTGKADLVSPAEPTLQGFTFSYDNCLGRLSMTLPDKPFAARWKKPGFLELLVPLESTKIPRPGAKPAATKYDKCEIAALLQKNIFLLLQNGVVVSISPENFAKKPALRQFTVGLDPRLLPRKPASPATPARRPLRPSAKPSTNPGSAASDSSN